MKSNQVVQKRFAGRLAVPAAILALALLFSVRAGSVAEAAGMPAPAQTAVAAASGVTAPPVLDDRDDHHCDGDRDHDDWACRFYRQPHQCDGDHGWDDTFCGWHDGR
jgi:hypothetical protein